MNQRPPVLFASLARVAAILFAIFVVGWLVVNAQRNSNRAAAGTPPVGPVPAPAQAGEQPVATQLEAAPTQPAPEFLFSSKSMVIEDRMLNPGAAAPAPVAPIYLYSSKSGRPIAPPATPVLTVSPAPTGGQRQR